MFKFKEVSTTQQQFLSAYYCEKKKIQEASRKRQQELLAGDLPVAHEDKLFMYYRKIATNSI